jgi:hypothetical protein
MTNAAALFSAAIGMRPVYQAGAWVWTGVNHAPRPVLSSSARYSRCTTLVGPRGTPTVDAAVECILGTAGEQS